MEHAPHRIVSREFRILVELLHQPINHRTIAVSQEEIPFALFGRKIFRNCLSDCFICVSEVREGISENTRRMDVHHVKAISKVDHRAKNIGGFDLFPCNLFFRPFKRPIRAVLPEVNPMSQPVVRFRTLPKCFIPSQYPIRHGFVAAVVAEDEPLVLELGSWRGA